MVCASCGATVPGTAKICGYCGTRLLGVPQVPVAMAAAPTAAEHATAPVHDPEAVATSSPVPTIQTANVAERSPPSSPTPRKSRRNIWLLLAAVAVTTIVAGIVAFYAPDDSLDDAPASTTAASPTPASTTPASSVALLDQPDYVGAWSTIDTDGSQMWLWIEPTENRSEYRIIFYDEGASGCDERMTVPALMDDVGRPVGGGEIKVVGATISCVQPDGSLTEIISGVETAYRYDPVKEAIVDSFDKLVWSRTDATTFEIFGR